MILGSTDGIILTEDGTPIKRYTGACPSCGKKNCIVSKPLDEVAFCETCGRGYSLELLDTEARLKDLLLIKGLRASDRWRRF